MAEIRIGDLWSDGRSGPVGQLVGEIALQRLRQPNEHWIAVRGTVFRGAGRVVIGRTAQEAYCIQTGGGCHHWANVSERQLRAVRADAVTPVSYLFVSLGERGDSIRTWLVPSEVVEGEVFLRRTAKAGAQWDLKIYEQDGRWVIFGADITHTHRQFPLSPDEQTAVERALEQERTRQRAPVELDEADAPPRVPDAPPAEVGAERVDAWPELVEEGQFRFQIRLFGRRFDIAGQVRVSDEP